ncbi:MAG: pyridoxal phosphate-dependent aminotransferase [Candidatus Micrarchaeota archaeon]
MSTAIKSHGVRRAAVPVGKTIFAQIAERLTRTDSIDLAWGNWDKWVGQRGEQELDHGARVFRKSPHSYAPPLGLPEFRRALAKKYELETGGPIRVDNVIVTVSGATGAMWSTVRHIIRAHGEARQGEQSRKVAFFCPAYFYPPFKTIINREGGRIYAYGLDKRGQPSVSSLDEQVGLAIKNGHSPSSIYVNSPHNPTGAIYARSKLEGFIEVARERGLPIIADEVYFRVVMPEARSRVMHVASLISGSDKNPVSVVQVDSPSKSKAWCGSRVGWVYFVDLRNFPMKQIKSGISEDMQILLGAPRVYQEFGGQGNVIINPDTGPLMAEIRKRRDAAMDAFNIEGMTIHHKPQAGFYLWIELDKNFGKWNSDVEFSMKLAEVAGIGVSPGLAFYCGEPGKEPGMFIRVALVQPVESIHGAGERTREFMKKEKR